MAAADVGGSVSGRSGRFTALSRPSMTVSDAGTAATGDEEREASLQAMEQVGRWLLVFLMRGLAGLWKGIFVELTQLARRVFSTLAGRVMSKQGRPWLSALEFVSWSCAGCLKGAVVQTTQYVCLLGSLPW